MSRPPASASSSSRLARAGAASWRALGVALLVVATGWAAGRLMPVLLPLSIAVLLTALLEPVTSVLRRRGVPGSFAALLAVALTLAALAGLVLLVVPPFAQRVAELGSSVNQGARQVAYELGRQVGMDHHAVDQAVAHGWTDIRAHAGGLAGDAVAGVSAVVAVAGSAVLVLFITFFLLRDGPRIWSWLVDLAPPMRRPHVDAAGRDAWTVLAVYTRGVVLVACFDAVFIGIALVVLGVPLALPLIVLTGLGAFFPIVGAITAGAAAVLVALVAKGFGVALIVLGAIVAVQQVEAHILYPVVVGPRLKLHPLAVLLAVAAGGTVAGLAGAFLAVPVTTVAAAVLRYARDRSDDSTSTVERARRWMSAAPAMEAGTQFSHRRGGDG